MRNQIQNRRDEKGFTLIELLVVIVILGILAAVVVFAVGGLTDKGNTSACKIDTRTLRTAEEAYSSQQASPAYTSAPNLVTTKFLADYNPATALHSIAVTADDPATPNVNEAAYEIQVTQTGIDKKCAPSTASPGDAVNGTTIL